MTAPAAAPRPRLLWLDVMKGLSILWIAFFHAFGSFTGDAYPSPLGPNYFARFFELCQPRSTMGTVVCLTSGFLVGVAKTGFHAVAVFLVLSGFGLTLGLAKRGDPEGGWGRWYFKRLVRLFPMYWFAHLLYLVSPFVSRPEPVDYRWILSFFGDRVWPIDSIFYYMNPALWYFGTLLQLYLVFPLLFRLLQRLGVGWFLVACGALTFGARHLMLNVLPVHGYWVQGGFFGARLWEFALGMALAMLQFQRSELLERRLFSLAALVVGLLTYTHGLYSYANNLTYVFTDALIGSGLFVILAHLARTTQRIPRIEAAAAYVGVYSYGLYLVHQPYVTYFSEAVRGVPMVLFVPLAAALVALLAVLSATVERAVNRLVDRAAG